MKKMFYLSIALVMLLGTSLSACNLVSPDCLEMPAPFYLWPTTTDGDDSFYVLGPGETEKPLYLKWGYPISDCMPDRFRVIVNDVPFMEAESLFEEIVSAPGVSIVGDEHLGTYVHYAVTTSASFPAGAYWFWVIPMKGEWFRGETGGPFQTHLFGEYCDRDEPYVATMPELVYPRNGQTIDTFSPTLVWRNRNDYENGCYDDYFQYTIYSQVTDELDLDLSGFPHNPTPSTGVEIATLGPRPYFITRSAALNLSECTRTWWKVIVVSPTRGEGYSYYIAMSSETFYFDIDPSLCAWVSAPLRDRPFDSPVIPTAKTLETANCRSGPTLDFPILSILPAGSTYEIRARNTPGDSWMVFDPAIDNSCWLADRLVEVTGDTGLVQVIDPEPTHTPVPDEPTAVNCSQWSSDQQACTANPACQWNPNLNPTSPCVNK